MHVSDIHTSSLSVSVYDKRKDFPFKVVRYPHLDSAIPSSIAYGVFTGQLHRFKLISSSFKIFVENACDVAVTLGRQRASFTRLQKTFASFCRERLFKTRWGVKIRSLIRFFNDCLEMKWDLYDGNPMQSTTAPSDPGSVSLACPRKVDGFAWLTRNFPQLTTPPPSVRNKSSLCEGLAMAHLNPTCLSSDAQASNILSPGLLCLRKTFPALTLPGCAFVDEYF